MIYIIGTVILILIIIADIVFLKYYKLKDIRTSIDMCAEKIDELLEKKLEIVNELLKNIKKDSIKKGFSYDENASLYDREDALFNVAFEINKYVKETGNKKVSKNMEELSTLEENLDGLKDFYNTNVLNYNEIFLKKPFNKIFKLLKFEQFKSFKIRKLQEYEIFKN